MIELRPYQQTVQDKTFGEWNVGNRNVMAVMPTGAGKSVLISDTVRKFDHQRSSGLVMAHRRELVGQMSLHIARQGVRHRIIAPKDVVSAIMAEHRRELGGQCFINPSAQMAVGGVDTIVSRLDQLADWLKALDMLVCDECFPAGTMIETDTGRRPIEAMRIGERVLAFDEQTSSFDYRPVTHVFKNKSPSDMVRLHINAHHVITCTSDHPFWTKRGWITAKDLKTDDVLFMVRRGSDRPKGPRTLSLQEDRKHFLLHVARNGVSGLQTVRSDETTQSEDSKNQGSKGKNSPSKTATTGTTESCSERAEACFSTVSDDMFCMQRTDHRIDESGAGTWSSVLQQRMLESILLPTVIRDDGADKSAVRIGPNDTAKSYETAGCPTEGFGFVATCRSQAEDTRRQRESSAYSGSDFVTPVRTARVQSAVCDPNQKETWVRVSDDIQTGLCTPGIEDSIGSGWAVTYSDQTSISGSEERPIFDWCRLDRVEIFQSNDHGKPDLGATNGYVYNIEVEDLNTYVADGAVVHNCHHVQKVNKWGKVFEACQRALGLLVTATPQRGDGHGLGRGELTKPAILDQYGRPIEPAEYDGDGVVDAMVIGPQMRELIDMGALTDYEIVCPPSDFDMSKLREGDEDFTRASLKEASNNSPKLVGDIVENYVKYAFGKRAVVFATDVETSGKIAAQFNAWGIPAASISAETDSGVRDDVIRRLRDGRLWVVCNVDLLGEGFDLPAIEVVIMARPTASLAVYMQQFGRALRPMLGKLFGLVIDHVSNIKRFGFPDKPRTWSLDRRQKRAAKEKDPELLDVLVCPNTGRPYEAIHVAACPHCRLPDGTPGNHTKPAGTGPVRAIEVVAGDLTRLTADDLAALRKAMQLPDPNTIDLSGLSGGAQAGQRNIAWARVQAQRELSDAIAHWAGEQRHGKGRDDSEIHRRFYAAVGMDMVSATGAAQSRQDMIAMTERVKAWTE